MAPVSPLDTRFVLSDQQAQTLAKEFGTPLYVLDEKHLRERIKRFVGTWPGDVSFASKANTTQAVLKIAFEEGCSIDVASEGEFRIALQAGVPANSCRLHGSNKTVGELSFAIEKGIGKIIVDSREEIERLAPMSPLPPLLLRVAPGVDPKTHAKISTGQADTKFGFALRDVASALDRCLDLGLPVIGFHSHVGSQLLDSEAQVIAAETLAQLALDLKRDKGFETKFINVGGGLGVKYTDADQPMPVEEYNASVLEAFHRILDGRLAPEFGMEPGRAMIAESGVTLYSVGVVKTAATGRVYVSVDGGLSDNPRPALYGSQYEVRWIGDTDTSQNVRISGKHCETDMLFDNVPAPKGAKAGDLVQVLCTGAYNMVMASNYNGYPRPASVLLRPDGRASLVQRRESWEQVLSRDLLPEDL